MTITEFLTVRLDEDEAVARAATPGPWATQTMAPALVYGDPSEGSFVAQTAVESAVSERALDGALHIEHFHPARVLADIAAKRAIVAEYVEAEAYYRTHTDAPAGELTGLGTAIRLLAQPYAEHPDFDESWKP